MNSPDKKTLVEQYCIVAKVNVLLALCDQLETQLTTTQSESRHLLEAILAEQLQHDLATIGE
jgi:type I restriction enzyme, S subunit